MSLVRTQACPLMKFVPLVIKTSALKLTKDKGYVLNKFLLHTFPQGYPIVKTIIVFKDKPEKEDIYICRRLLKSYNLALENSQKRQKDIWTDLAETHHREFLEILKSNDAKVLAEYMIHVHARGISQGLVQGEIEYEKMRKSQIFRRFLGVNTKDKLVSLAEYLGILPYENPEQGRYGKNIYAGESKIVAEINKKLGFDIENNDFENGLLKLKIKKGSIHVRDIYALYTSLRVTEIVGKKARIAEIGGGVGKAAYYAYKLGIRDYSIFDLPHINLLQGYFLLKALPNSVSLYGEKEKAIKILPDFEFEKVNNKFDLTLNEDSFPEISKKVVMNYLKNIKLNTKKYFLSINQEGESSAQTIKQSIVGNLISESRGFKKEYRFPFWVRKGYIEELYSIIKP